MKTQQNDHVGIVPVDSKVCCKQRLVSVVTISQPEMRARSLLSQGVTLMVAGVAASRPLAARRAVASCTCARATARSDGDMFSVPHPLHHSTPALRVIHVLMAHSLSTVKVLHPGKSMTSSFHTRVSCTNIECNREVAIDLESPWEPCWQAQSTNLHHLDRNTV